MPWLLLLSAIIYYSSEIQAQDIHAPPDIGSHLGHLEGAKLPFLTPGADKNPQFLTFPVNESLDEDAAVPCWNASACAYTIYPVLGMVIGPCIPYIIGLVLAFGGLLITMFTDEAYKENGLDKTFYSWAQIFLYYHCGLCSARWWPFLRQELHLMVKLVGFLGPSIFFGLLLSPWVIGPAYTLSCGYKDWNPLKQLTKYDSHDDHCYVYLYIILGFILVAGVFGFIFWISCLYRNQGRPAVVLITPPESPRSQQ